MHLIDLKNWLELSTGLDRDSLHIYAGVAIHLVAALFLRRPLASPIPWLFVAIVAVTNELHDYSFVPEASNGDEEPFDEAVKDVWNTLLLPSIFLLIARIHPNWLTSKLDPAKKPEKQKRKTPPV